jgi:hypothetical protein
MKVLMKSEVMEAFVYLWQDARQKPYRYYLGYHKGHPDDGYTHSSKVFESFNKNNIPDGVKRRILATGTSEEMMELENKLLNNRKDRGKWDIYYNLTASFPPPPMWGEDSPTKRPETRKKISEAQIGPKNHRYGKTGEKSHWYGKSHSEETKQKMSNANKGENNPNYGKSHSEEAKRKMSNANKGENNPNYGKSHSEEAKRKIATALTGKVQLIVSCPHCGQRGGSNNMKRYHFSKCKYKNEE